MDQRRPAQSGFYAKDRNSIGIFFFPQAKPTKIAPDPGKRLASLLVFLLRGVVGWQTSVERYEKGRSLFINDAKG